MIEDLPVVVALPEPLGTEVTRWIEHDLGWQVVDRDGPLLPALALADRPHGGLPWIGVVDGAVDQHRTRGLLEAGAADVIGWPDDRARVPLVAVRLDVHRRRMPRGRRLVVAGVAGGVGTSTIALAVGGLLAWRGAAVLVTGSPALAELAGVTAASGAHRAVAGVPRLSVSVADGPAPPWDGDLVVIDDGVAGGVVAGGSGIWPTGDGATVVVTRADAGLRRARASGRPVIVVGDRPLTAAEVRRVLGRPPLVHLPSSVRVARAGLTGRVPAGLPGRWLRTLEAGLRELERVAA
jgi:hypothetical protein